jgi:hypothetical protein
VVYNTKTNHIVKSVIKHGYYVCNLNINNKSKQYKVHRLIADVFILNQDNKPIVNHIDGIKTNNNIENLEWVTHKENTNHAIKTGLILRNNSSYKYNKIENYNLDDGKPIKNYNNYYIFSNGNIYNTKTKILLKQFKKADGYMSIGLTKNGKCTLILIHVLLGTHFIPNPNNKPIVNHIDGNKTNNNINNLEWVTLSENVLHAYENKLNKLRKFDFDFIIQYNLENKEINRFKSISEASKQTNINRCSISKTCNGIHKTAGRYIWKYLKNNVITENNINNIHKWIVQYNLDNKEINRFKTITEASDKTNIYMKGISDACKGKRTTTGGYIWKIINNNTKDKTKFKYIIQYDLNNTKIGQFNTIKEASEKNKIDSSAISKVCKNKQKTAGNYIWKYAL